MRLSLEPLLYKYGVDIVFAGCDALPMCTRDEACAPERIVQATSSLLVR